MSDFLWPHGLQHTSFLCPPLFPRVCSDSCPLYRWCYLTISSSATPFCFAFDLAQHQSLMSWLFPYGDQSIGASASVLPVNIQGWFPSGLTGLISLKFKGFSRVFSRTIQKHQFICAQPSLRSNSHICTWLLEKHSFYYKDLCQQSGISAF